MFLTIIMKPPTAPAAPHSTPPYSFRIEGDSKASAAFTPLILALLLIAHSFPFCTSL